MENVLINERLQDKIIIRLGNMLRNHNHFTRFITENTDSERLWSKHLQNLYLPMWQSITVSR